VASHGRGQLVPDYLDRSAHSLANLISAHLALGSNSVLGQQVERSDTVLAIRRLIIGDRLENVNPVLK
jgi:hypothetical protein